ncbi:MAG: hypothetical protein IT219_12205 [Bacteroidales bacterium]|nr:hypothetical protein [Bacteroidales bacterium]
MKNVVGQVPRGTNFYPRNDIINRIYSRLESGNHLYLSAPRRSGKTSIMRALEDAPREGYVFIYVDVEDCKDQEDYFRMLAEELEKSDAKGTLEKLSNKGKSTINSFLDRFKRVKIGGVEIETTQPDTPINFTSAFEDLLRELEPETKLVIMVDEFPIAVENIAKVQGSQAAVHFLHANRAMRQRAKNGVLFIYTGSIGLPSVARKLDPAPTINDLNIVDVTPLNPKEALDMCKILFQAGKVPLDDDVIGYLLDKIAWHMPFFIQLLVQMLKDTWDNTQLVMTTESVDKALEKAASTRSNAYLASYLDRLNKTLQDEQRSLALRILSIISNNGSIHRNELNLEETRNILEILEYDGYIYEKEGIYRFNSPILKMWWQKNA